MATITDDRSRGRGWVVRYRDPDGKQRSKSFPRERDARAWMTSTEHSKQVGQYVAPAGGKVLFGDRWTTWYDTTVNLRPSTRARDLSYARSLILPTFEKRRLGDIDHDAVQGWVARLIAEGKAPATVHRAHQIMSKVMRSAVKARLISRNPCDDTELPRIEREEQRFLTPKEVARLASTIDPRYRVWVLTAAYSGLRAGELFGLKAGRCDTMRAQLDVLEILVEVNGHHHQGPPKTRAGRRRVPIPRFVADELAQHVAGLAADELVFTAPGGGMMRSSLFNRRIWQPATAAAGLGEIIRDPETRRSRYEGLRIHDLRHTAVAFWIAAGASPTEVAARAGHSSVVTVLDRYGHLLPRDDDKVTDALDLMARAADAEPMGEVVNLRRS